MANVGIRQYLGSQETNRGLGMLEAVTQHQVYVDNTEEITKHFLQIFFLLSRISVYLVKNILCI